MRLLASANPKALPDGRTPAARAVQVQIYAKPCLGFTTFDHEPFPQAIPIPHLPGQFGLIYRRRGLNGKRTPYWKG